MNPPRLENCMLYPLLRSRITMFTNATCVMIGDKEVQSIVTSDGGILYEKSSTGCALRVSSNKSSISHSLNESATITATLTNDGVGVSGETISFKGISGKYVDNASSANLSKYDISSATVTYNSNAYDVSVSHPGGGITTNGVLKLPIIEFTDFTFEAKISASTVQENSFLGLRIGSSTERYDLTLSDTAGHKFLAFKDKNNTGSVTTDGMWSTGNYYIIVMSLEGTTLTGTIYDSSYNQLFTHSFSLTSEIVSALSYLDVVVADANPSSGSMAASVKDIKVTALNSTLLTENLGNSTTNNNGAATISYVGEAAGSVTIKGEYNALNGSVNLTVT